MTIPNYPFGFVPPPPPPTWACVWCGEDYEAPEDNGACDDCANNSATAIGDLAWTGRILRKLAERITALERRHDGRF